MYARPREDAEEKEGKILCNIPCWGRKRAKNMPWIIANHGKFSSLEESIHSFICFDREKGWERWVGKMRCWSTLVQPLVAVMIGSLVEWNDFFSTFSTTC
jgi:hypothetical protein